MTVKILQQQYQVIHIQTARKLAILYPLEN